MGAFCPLCSRPLEGSQPRTPAPVALTIRVPDLGIEVIHPAISLTSAAPPRNRTVSSTDPAEAKAPVMGEDCVSSRPPATCSLSGTNG